MRSVAQCFRGGATPNRRGLPTFGFVEVSGFARNKRLLGRVIGGVARRPAVSPGNDCVDEGDSWVNWSGLATLAARPGHEDLQSLNRFLSATEA